jgi:hypothetical protein
VMQLKMSLLNTSFYITDVKFQVIFNLNYHIELEHLKKWKISLYLTLILLNTVFIKNDNKHFFDNFIDLNKLRKSKNTLSP